MFGWGVEIRVMDFIIRLFANYNHSWNCSKIIPNSCSLWGIMYTKDAFNVL